MEIKASHIDIFTGIGGFTLACRWNGIKTEVMCEADERCRQFLQKTYPNIPVFPDVRDFDGTEWRGAFILTAGVPCQPASRAGKQRGKKDDRWLWPEALRIVEEASPRWCLFENPPGIYEVGIDGILSHLESIGYETGVVEIPACAVNAPQRRARVWIVAHATRQGCERTGSEFWQEAKQQQPSESGESNLAHAMQPGSGTSGESKKGRRVPVPDTKTSNVAHCPSNGRQQGADLNGTAQATQERTESCEHHELHPWDNNWTPCADGKLRRTPDNSFVMADGVQPGILQTLAEEGWPHRSLLGALGNSIVPQVAYEIIRTILEVDWWEGQRNKG